jgi:hypothetical protein
MAHWQHTVVAAKLLLGPAQKIGNTEEAADILLAQDNPIVAKLEKVRRAYIQYMH